MSRESERTARQSIIDRLIDNDPKLAADPPGTWSGSVAALKASLLRDLEALLNTRRIIDPAPDAYPEVQRSVYHFGMPDITSLSADDADHHRQLAIDIEECIRLFEPRLSTVRVTLGEADPEKGRRVRFIVDGLLRMEPNPERIFFDTVLETPTGKFFVSGDGDA
ncbi:MAG TPA: type VI secretion system baseplate subunit TssE [Longimicrobiales bacterium]|nr:type VI secretion system baseplate subunit TssE [Longimicrobiales bacterium]